MIKPEDLLKYLGKEVFMKRHIMNKYEFFYTVPEIVTITGVCISANGAETKAEIGIDSYDGIPITVMCKEVFATKEDCQKECLVDLKEKIEYVKEGLAELESVRKEWEK